MHASRASVEAGGLMSYGPDFLDLFRRSADCVEKKSGRGSRVGDRHRTTARS